MPNFYLLHPCVSKSTDHSLAHSQRLRGCMRLGWSISGNLKRPTLLRTWGSYTGSLVRSSYSWDASNGWRSAGAINESVCQCYLQHGKSAVSAACGSQFINSRMSCSTHQLALLNIRYYLTGRRSSKALVAKVFYAQSSNVAISCEQRLLHSCF